RKEMFMSLMTPDQLDKLRQITEKRWHISVQQWMNFDQLSFFAEVKQVMCQIPCIWAGVPIKAHELTMHGHDLLTLIEAFVAVGPRHCQGRMARKRSERQIRLLIRDLRVEKQAVAENAPLHAIAFHRDLNGKLLAVQIAAVEVLNILRPIVAIGRYITFGVVALHQYPETYEKMEADAGKHRYSQWFVQEVRRF